MNLKKTFKSVMFALIGITMPAIFSACSSENETIVQEAPEQIAKHMVMHMEGGIQDYVDETTRATMIVPALTVPTWQNNEKVYLRFKKADGTIVRGNATYSSFTSEWDLNYFGSLSEGGAYTCEAYYFTNAQCSDNENITLGAQSAIYIDRNATYEISNNVLTLKAALKPITARVKFVDYASSTPMINVEGFTYNTSFTLSSGTFNTSGDGVELYVDPKTYATPYIYAALTKSDVAINTFGAKYTKTFSGSKFAQGESGYINIPTNSVNNGWKVSAVTANMPLADMGTSVYWSRTNLQAANEYSAGVACSWGDPYATNTSTSSSYNSAITEIAGNTLHDIVAYTYTSKGYNNWRMPTKAEWNELFDACTWEYTSSHPDNSSVRGWWATSKTTGNKIFFPMYQYVTGSTTEFGTSSSSGYYWTSSYYNSSNAYCIYLSTSGYNSSDYNYKYYKCMIRPVYKVQ